MTIYGEILYTNINSALRREEFALVIIRNGNACELYKLVCGSYRLCQLPERFRFIDSLKGLEAIYEYGRLSVIETGKKKCGCGCGNRNRCNCGFNPLAGNSSNSQSYLPAQSGLLPGQCYDPCLNYVLIPGPAGATGSAGPAGVIDMLSATYTSNPTASIAGTQLLLNSMIGFFATTATNMTITGDNISLAGGFLYHFDYNINFNIGGTTGIDAVEARLYNLSSLTPTVPILTARTSIFATGTRTSIRLVGDINLITPVTINTLSISLFLIPGTPTPPPTDLLLTGDGLNQSLYITRVPANRVTVTPITLLP